VLDPFLVVLFFFDFDGLGVGTDTGRTGRVVVTAPPPSVRAGAQGAEAQEDSQGGQEALHRVTFRDL